ncbi:unnamed protein product, partial [Prunus brigantina]
VVVLVFTSLNHHQHCTDSKMYLSKFIVTFFFLLTITLVLTRKHFTDNTEDIHECLSSNTFATNDTYHKNLKTLTTFLSEHVASSQFINGSIGFYPNDVYGFAICFGNTSATDCSNYVNVAFTLIQAHCPNNKGAVIWFADSQVKYMNHDFSGEIDYYDLALKHVNGNSRPFTTMTNKFAPWIFLVLIVRGVFPTCCDGKIGATIYSESCWIAFSLGNAYFD